MSEEKELIKKRGSFKGRLTAFSTFINSLKPSSLSSTDVNELQLRIGKLQLIFDQYDEVQLKLECCSDNLEVHSNRNDFESSYYSLLAKAQDIVNNYSSQNDNKSVSSSSGKHRIVKLPTIQLPKFSGKAEDWLGFRDMFLSLIHSDTELDNINKFHYLRTAVEGSAEVVVKSVKFADNNYETAWKLLCERFDSKRLLVHDHVTALFNLEPITKESSIHLKHLIDELNKNLLALESLGEPVNYWDTLLIHMVSGKLDFRTYREWEEYKDRLDKNATITFQSFNIFLRNRANFIEKIEKSRCANQGQTKQFIKHKTMVSIQDTTNNNNLRSIVTSKSCPMCHNNDHNLNSCSQFLALNNESRLKLLPTFKVCFNCFHSGHFANRCKKQGCKICKRKHNTIIHITDFSKQKSFERNGQSADTINNSAVGESSATVQSNPSNMTLSVSVASSFHGRGARCAHAASVGKDIAQVLLSTALIKLYDAYNREYIARAVLDSGSTSCLISEKMFSKLKLPAERINKSILGINNVSTQIKQMCNIRIHSLNEQYSTDIRCFVLPSITERMPSESIDLSTFNISSDIVLADPRFFACNDVDLIIGADIFWDLLGSRKIKLGECKPWLFETKLGWIVSGPINSGCVSKSHRIRCNFVKDESLNNSSFNDEIQTQLTRFWQLEEVSPNSSSHLSKEESLCEKHFTKHTIRLQDGRFCVRIPLKENPELLGDSYQRAKHCFLSLERRNETKPLLGNLYKSFMAEYLLLGHMSECSMLNTNSHFIPHHGILRESSTTTKLRAVFNGSSPTSSGVTLNDIQMVGPQVQDDLLSILIRFRQHKFVLAADVEKMYRQVMVHPDDRYLQQILWRFDRSDPINAFQLNTVTYGTASAPYLATRCLKQVGLECKDSDISEIIIKDFYVDDLLTGGDTLANVHSIRERVTDALSSAGMPLRKWKSNDPQLTTDFNQTSLDLNVGVVEPSKTLGLGWNTESDQLYFPICDLVNSCNTKRGILSVISQIFDPLGLLAPCVIRMKLILQRMWLEKLSWDDQLSTEVGQEWTNILNTLPLLNQLRVPRHVICEQPKSIQMHIFTDASERAYGACIYLRSTSETGSVLVKLLIAKSRVAPIKPTTIPRLELCGALVGVRLFEKAISSLRLKINNVFFWTDSTIVLGWLQMVPNKLQPFVRNRVAEIVEKTNNYVWRHVSTNDNPADYITRGVNFELFKSLDIWWSGPDFLKQSGTSWPAISQKNELILPEIKGISLQVNVVTKPEQGSLLLDFNRFSNISRLKRTAAYILRFVNKCKGIAIPENYLTFNELQSSMNLLIKMSQMESFPEYKLLMNNKTLPKSSTLLKFNVFLDENKIMRVGGRLANSSFNFDKKHPIILQSAHRFTKLLFNYVHLTLMHAGPQLLLNSIREQYWPIGSRNLAKNLCHQCMRCTRAKGQVIAPLMGNLPKNRLTPGGYPFDSVGVDYAGPLAAVSRQGRGSRVIKVYISIFVCFTTKAIHLELVGDLTSQCYMSALRRFMSRRGKPQNIYSDNGTSFVGAYNELSKFLKNNCNSLGESIANEGIQFHFIPAYSPHFGGLWEAGVKSTKHHLVRVLGNCHLTYEELNTTLVQIEAILNSRPLTPISSDPEDFTPLIAGHFLIGRSFTALPDRSYKETTYNHLNRFQRIQQLREHFWNRWSKEYITQLQHRTKWRTSNEPLKLNTLVILREDHLPPLKWRLGRIIAVHPGSDNISRVADVKTSSGIVRRSFSKICPLPEVSS